MNSRTLEEQRLLQRLSGIKDTLVKQEHPVRKNGMSMEEALTVYMERVLPAITVNLHTGEIPVQKKQKEISSDIREVVEVSQIVRKQKENARERRNKKKEEKSHAFKQCMENAGCAENSGNRAYDRLDCSRKEAYLLYAYDKSGCHSMIGKDISPGSYGGSLTRGDFKSKA